MIPTERIEPSAMNNGEAGVTELLPCPHCGGPAELLIGGPGNHWVKCTVCGASSDDSNAIAAWNRRTPSPKSIREGVAWIVVDQNADVTVPEEHVEAVRKMFQGPPIEINGQRLKKAARFYASPPTLPVSTEESGGVVVSTVEIADER